MPLLIDGHNLIGRMPELSLEDPHDEAKLVQRVRRYCRRRHRRATIVFDAGLPGGRASHLSASPVEVIFASSSSSADRVIRQRILDARDPRGLVVVSSDRAVQEVARSRGARVVAAEQFAAQWLGAPDRRQPAKPSVSGDELREWLELFGFPDE